MGTDVNELRAILTESDCMMEPGPWTWDVNEGPDGHWTNTFPVLGPNGEFVAECEYRPQAELLVAAHNHLGALLDVAEAARERLGCPSCRMCDTDPPLRDALASLDALTERP